MAIRPPRPPGGLFDPGPPEIGLMKRDEERVTAGKVQKGSQAMQNQAVALWGGGAG